MVHQFLTRRRIAAPFRLALMVGRSLADVVLPPICLGCGQRVRTAETLLCFACIRSADRADIDDVHERIDRHPEVRSSIDGAFALWIFDKGGLLQHVHQALKYGNRPYYGIYLGRMLGCAFEQTLRRRPSPEVIVPIPLYRTRRYERGYNQSEYLAVGLAEVLQLPVCPDALERTRGTQAQTALKRAARLHNLDGAFAVSRPAAVARRRVLLIDDILTTGATVGAAATALRAAEAWSVDVALLGVART